MQPLLSPTCRQRHQTLGYGSISETYVLSLHHPLIIVLTSYQCGVINSLKLLRDDNGDSASATIEFESKEDILTAQTKDMKSFDGRAIHVQVGTGTTVYVANHPPAADEAWLREKFEPVSLFCVSHVQKLIQNQYGAIIDIRLPSLKYNTHRRFCYIQYQSSDQARAALELDGQKFDGDHEILVRVSDPEHKQDRHGAMHEGRELYIANVDWRATKQEVKEAFSQYGKIENVRLPIKANGDSKGIAFVVFKEKVSRITK